jgi:pulcherriminic acid synthase
MAGSGYGVTTNLPITGANGVVIPAGTRGDAGFRTFEVYQRERVGSSTEKIQPSDLMSTDFQKDPYPALAILRENYPCYRDWLTNSFWITRYDDVTSIFTDDANFETRSQASQLGLEMGQNLAGELSFQTAWVEGFHKHVDASVEAILDDLSSQTEADLAIDFAARLPLEILTRILDLPDAERIGFAAAYCTMIDGVTFLADAQHAGRTAAARLADLLRPHVHNRRGNGSEDLVSTVADLDATAEDLVATLLEVDLHTLHGGLANMWYLLVTHPAQYDQIADNSLHMKIAWLETLRHSTPILAASRYARHEIERFGRLLPEGARLVCSAAAANRDPRTFKDPDRFDAVRGDICHREARGQYRADGLATGITVALGPPSKHPAVPEDRPVSLYALMRDTAQRANRMLTERLADLRLAPGATPTLVSRRLGDMHTCWHLPVQYNVR